MQKFAFKRDPERVFLGRIAPNAISDGKRHVLANGFWGVSRHVNYLGEILMACGLALVLGWPLPIGPWLYPLYYVLLLGFRERDDDKRCAEKYGPLWEEYRRRVRWRIVPGSEEKSDGIRRRCRNIRHLGENSLELSRLPRLDRSAMYSSSVINTVAFSAAALAVG